MHYLSDGLYVFRTIHASSFSFCLILSTFGSLPTSLKFPSRRGHLIQSRHLLTALAKAACVGKLKAMAKVWVEPTSFYFYFSLSAKEQQMLTE